MAEVDKVIAELEASPLESKEALAEVLQEKASEFNRARELYDKSIRAMGVQTAFSILRASVSIPIAEALAKYVTFGKATSIGIAGAPGMASITAELHKTAFERSKQRQAKPVPFYLSQIAKAHK